MTTSQDYSELCVMAAWLLQVNTDAPQVAGVRVDTNILPDGTHTPMVQLQTSSAPFVDMVTGIADWAVILDTDVLLIEHTSGYVRLSAGLPATPTARHPVEVWNHLVLAEGQRLLDQVGATEDTSGIQPIQAKRITRWAVVDPEQLMAALSAVTTTNLVSAKAS